MSTRTSSPAATAGPIVTAASLGSIFFGLHLMAACQSIYFLAHGPRSVRQKTIYIGFTGFMLILFILREVLFSVNLSNIPPPVSSRGQSFDVYFGNPIQVMIVAVICFANIASDLLLLYRLHMLWQKALVIILPSFILLGSIVGTFYYIVMDILKGQNKVTHDAVMRADAVWVSFTVCFNCVITSLFIYRLTTMYREIDRDMPLNSTKLIYRAGSILVESALPFSITGVVFAVLSFQNNPANISTVGLWHGMIFLSPQMIVLRVALSDDRAASQQTSLDFIQTPQASIGHVVTLDLVETPSRRDSMEDKKYPPEFQQSYWTTDV